MAAKSVLITGCSAGGIGYSLAQEFQSHGLTVFATARTLSKISNLEKLSNVTLLPLDVTSASSIAAAVEAVKAKTGGKLDYLVNNSGRTYCMPALDVDIEEAKLLFDVNVWGVLAMVQAFAPLLIEAKGTLVNIGSIVAYLNVPYGSIYNASKAAITLLSETLRLELAPLGVKVVTVVTGSTETKLHDNAPTPKLPPSSRYLPAEKQIVDTAQGNDTIQRMNSDDFAARVVKDILKGARGKLWRGNNAALTRYASILMPTSMADSILSKDKGLEHLP